MPRPTGDENETLIFETDTPYGHYQVVDMLYDGRPARVLFSGQRYTAQSGVALDNRPELLFEYNERFMELVEEIRPKRLLLIGGGAYTLPMALMKRYPMLLLDVVEPDAGLRSLSEAYFGFQSSPELTIITGNGRSYLEATTRRYDLIIVDAFINEAIPKTLTSGPAITQIARCLRSTGVVGVNIISAYYGRSAEPLKRLYEAFDKHFKVVDVAPASAVASISYWMPQNFLLVAQLTGNRSITLRYQMLPPLA